MKRSLRDYLVTLVLAVLVFAVVSVFLIKAAEGLMSDVVDKIGSEGETQEETVTEEKEPVPENTTGQTPPQQDPAPQEEDRVLTALILGLDENKQNAETILLVGINATKKQMTLALIPSNTVVPEQTGKYQLGSLYSSRSVNFYKEFIQQETGIMPDFYVAMPPSAAANLVDILGGISYNVPEDMQYADPAKNIKIDLKKGEQTISGSALMQMLSYPGYKNGLAGKEDATLGFVRNLCTAFLTSGNASRAESIWNNMYHNCQTDFEQMNLKEWSDVLFQVTSYSQNYVRIPGAKSGSFYAISSSRAKSMFEIYK